MSNILIQDLYKTYPGTPPVKALDNISLDVEPGGLGQVLADGVAGAGLRQPAGGGGAASAA